MLTVELGVISVRWQATDWRLF